MLPRGRLHSAVSQAATRFALVDPATTFKSKSTLELLRALLVFRLCTVRPLVAHGKEIIAASQRAFGRRLTSFAIRHTFFRHFCAGESVSDIESALAKLRAAGVGGILDFAAESDVPSSPSPPQAAAAEQQPGAARGRRTSSTADAALDRNLEVTIRTVETAGRVGGSAAVKLTALADPDLLRHISEMLHDHRRAFRRFNLDQLESPYVALTPSPARLRRVLSGPGLSDSEVEDLFRAANYRGDGRLDYLQWSDFLALLRLGDEESVAAAALVRPGLSPDSLFALLTPAATVTLSSDERSRLKAVLRRADALARAASSAKVAVMVDAEQTYMQPAIDWVTLTMQRKYNRPDPAAWEQPEAAHVVRLHKAHEQAQPILRPAHARASSLLSTLAPTPVPPPHAGPPVSAEHAVVFGTVQAYTVDAVPRLQLLLARAQREGFMQATKLVRGAYMVQERARASQLGYKDPIHPTLEATHAAFHDCSELLLEAVSKRQAAALFATHNEASVVHLARRMQDLGLAPADPRVSFGQLLGMCDHLTYSLAAAKFRAFKYIPYGPVHEVIPYLLRRAQENSDLLHGGVGHEIALLQTELANRLGLPGKRDRV